MPKLNDEGLELIKSFESCRLTAYLDTAGHRTIGWGHMNDKLSVATTITQDQADEILEDDLTAAECVVNNFVRAPLNENQFSALVSFVFNEGPVRFKQSTMLKLINARDYVGAADEFPRWDIAGGVVEPGLLRRREAEKALFLKEASSET